MRPGAPTRGPLEPRWAQARCVATRPRDVRWISRSAAGRARRRPRSCPSPRRRTAPAWSGPPAAPRSAPHSVARMARSTLSRPSSSTPKSSRPSLAVAPSMKPSPRTSAKSRTRRRRRLATRGVPRERSDIRMAPSASMPHLQDPGRPLDDGPQVRRVVEIQPADEAEAVAQRPRDEAGAGRGADQGEARAAPGGWSERSGPCRSGCPAGRPPWPSRASPRRSGAGGGSRR